MKKFYKTAAYFFLFFVATSMSLPPREEGNEVQEFLIKTAEDHRLALKEAETAIDRGTIADVRAFGELVVKEENALLTEIEALAGSRKVDLPPGMGREGEKKLTELSSKSGVAFNKLFVKRMESHHKAVIRKFTWATEKLTDDKEVCAFANRYINQAQVGLIRLKKMKSKL